MWLAFALITPLLFGLVHVLDGFCVAEIYEKPWMGAVVGSLASLIAFIPLPYLAPLLSWQVPTLEILGLGLLAGALIQLSQFCYFHALYHAEAGVVAAYWNLVPGLVPVASFIFLGQVLTGTQYLGIALLIVAAVAFCLLGQAKKGRWQALWLMVIAAVMQAAMFLLQDQVFEELPYLEGFYIITVGLVATGLLPLLIKPLRQEFVAKSEPLLLGTKLFIAIELINLLALATSQKAVALGIPSLVAAVESTIPAYTFFISAILLAFAPKFADAAALKNLPQKLTLVTLMVLGVWLVS